MTFKCLLSEAAFKSDNGYQAAILMKLIENIEGGDLNDQTAAM